MTTKNIITIDPMPLSGIARVVCCDSVAAATYALHETSTEIALINLEAMLDTLPTHRRLTYEITCKLQPSAQRKKLPAFAYHQELRRATSTYRNKTSQLRQVDNGLLHTSTVTIDEGTNIVMHTDGNFYSSTLRPQSGTAMLTPDDSAAAFARAKTLEDSSNGRNSFIDTSYSVAEGIARNIYSLHRIPDGFAGMWKDTILHSVPAPQIRLRPEPTDSSKDVLVPTTVTPNNSRGYVWFWAPKPIAATPV